MAAETQSDISGLSAAKPPSGWPRNFGCVAGGHSPYHHSVGGLGRLLASSFLIRVKICSKNEDA